MVTRILLVVGAIIGIGILLGVVARGEVVTRDRILLYDFSEGSGTVVNDKSGVTPLINLTIPDPTKVEWISKGLRVKEATLLKTSDPTTKIAASNFSSGITIEVWVKPLNNTQSGPARIVTYSADSGNRNFTLGQEGDHYQQRFRTSTNPGNGTAPSTSSPAGGITTTPVLQHVVYTRDSSGSAKIYIDKVEVGSEAVTGDLSNWDATYGFGLFNEINYPTDTRTWLGEIYLVAIYSTVLTPEEIAQNYDAGGNTGTVTLAWDANTEPDLKGYKIHYGFVSRGTDSLEQIQKWCDAHEPTNEKCVEEWEAICKEPLNRTCHTMLFDYAVVMDVVTQPEGRAVGCPDPYDPFKAECCEYTLKNLERGKTYYLAGTAYDQDGNESAFSEELTHVVSGVTRVINLRRIPDEIASP